MSKTATIDAKHIHRVVVKIGSSSLQHPETGGLDFIKIEKLARELCDLRNRGLDVCLVSSGAIAVGRKVLGINDLNGRLPLRQACASVGQANLMLTYQKAFSDFQQQVGQILMTKNTILDNVSRKNCENTFEALFELGIIPIVNENDTISTYEIQFGDNDTLSALVASLTGADLLILLSDIDGLYTDDPRQNKDAELVKYVDEITPELDGMAKGSTGSNVGTGGMEAKLRAAKIATASGAQMVIANAKDVSIIHKILDNNYTGTLFESNYDEDFYMPDYVEEFLT